MEDMRVDEGMDGKRKREEVGNEADQAEGITHENKRIMIGNVSAYAVNDEAEDWMEDEAGQVGPHGVAEGPASADELDPREVQRAREEEMDFVKKMPVYEERDVEECWRVT